MPADTVLGTVSVVITGDTSRLNADFARAEALAKKAGLGTSEAFNSAAAAARNLTQASAAFGPGVAAGNATAIAALKQYESELARATASLEGEITAVNADTGAKLENAAATKALGAAHAHAVTEIQATSGAIRVFEGHSALRAAERFLTTIPGVGAALQAAFPVIGAIALLDIFGKMISRGEELKKTVEDLGKATKETDDKFSHLVATLDNLGVKQIGREFGPTAEAKARATQLRMEADDARRQISGLTVQLLDLDKHGTDLLRNGLGSAAAQALIPTIHSSVVQENENKINTIRQQIDGLQADIYAKEKQAQDALADAALSGVTTSGAAAAARLSNQESAASRLGEMARLVADFQIAQAHAVEVKRIASINDVDRAYMESAREEVRLAQAKEDSINAILIQELPKRIALIRAQGEEEKKGKTPDEAARINESTAGKVAQLEDAAAKEAFAAHANFVAAVNALDVSRISLIKKQAEDAAAAWLDAYDVITNAAKASQKSVEDGVAKDLENRIRVLEVEDQGQGESGALKVEREKLALAQKYALLIAPSAKQQIDYATQALQIEQRARDTRIAGLEEKRKDALTLDSNPETNTKAADIQRDINKLKEEGANKDIEAQTRILVLLQRQRLEAQLKGAVENAIHQVPGALAGGLARGIIDGKAIGRDVREALKGVGEQLLGTILKDLIVKIGAEIAAHTILGAVMVWLGGTQSTALALNTTAVTANTVAVHASTLKSAAGGIAGGVGGAASGGGSAASGAASSAASGLVGPLIAAAGGIIGGVISGVMSLIGAHQIVKAVNATTAAVLSLKGSSIGDSKSNALTGANATPGATATSGASQGGFVGFFASILGFGGSKPVDVNIVSISPLSPLKGFFNLFGFAEGGRPAKGVPYIVGEKGPELRIDDNPGTIIPAGAFNLPSTNVPQYMRAGLPAGGDSAMFASSNSSSIGDMSFHAHGMTNPEQFIDHVMRKLPDRLKARSPQFSPYSR